MFDSAMISLTDKFINVNITLILFVILLLCFGFVAQYSSAGGNLYPFANRQIWLSILSIPIVIFIISIKTKQIKDYAYYIYIIALLFLLYTFLVSSIHVGTVRWTKIFGINLQSSEFTKFALILCMAKYFSETPPYRFTYKLSEIIIPSILSAFPIFIILVQPNLGTAIVLVVMTVFMFFVACTDKKIFIALFIIGLISIPIMWKKLYPYQKQRIMTFLHPENDPLGTGYNIIQSKITIGSGNFTGKGLIKGTQTQLSYLPEKRTDFAFTIIAEEFGFIGALTIIILYFLLIGKILLIALNSTSMFNRIICTGTAAFFLVHLFINIGMTMGLLPVVGIPLPLISYGGSNMLTTIICISLVLHVDIHTKIKSHLLT